MKHLQNGNNEQDMNNVTKIFEKFAKQDDKLDDIISELKSISGSLKNMSENSTQVKDKILGTALEKDDRIIKLAGAIIKTLCLVIGCLVVWFTGLKEHLPQIADVLLKIF